MFRRYRFESLLDPLEFSQRLRSMVTQKFAVFTSKRGKIYGRVRDGGFDLRTSSTTRGSVIWVIGKVDLQAKSASGMLRIVPDPIGSFSFVIIVAVAVGLQFLPEAGWLRVALPAFALGVTVFGVMAGRAEWRHIVKRLENELGVTLSAPS